KTLVITTFSGINSVKWINYKEGGSGRPVADSPWPVRARSAALLGQDVPMPATECYRCGYVMASGQLQCPACGLSPNSPIAAELADLEATARQIQRFNSQG